MSTTAPNTQLGKYQLVRQVASGEMTELWLALDGERKVAIKRIRAEVSDDKKYVQAFAEQARRASILHHATIARITDVGPPNGDAFYVTDWIEGIDLRAALAVAHAADQQIRIEHVMTIMLAVCEAFQYAHKKGIFHLDISPANILLGFDGSVKVIDFGIATAVNRAKTRPGAQEGKVGYMSPELCLGKSADARSDIFSLGVVLYELITVRRLFKAATDFLTMSTIIEGQVPRPSTVRPGVAPELEEIIMKALESPREARYQTAAELQAALEKFCRGNTIDLSRDSLADYARVLAERKQRAASDPTEARSPEIISGEVENSTKLRQKTQGGNDSTQIVRAIAVNSPGPSKKLVFVALGGIVALAIIGIAIYMVQPSGETPSDAEPAAAPVAAPTAPTPEPMPAPTPEPTPVVEPRPAAVVAQPAPTPAVAEPKPAPVAAQPQADEAEVIEVDEAADHAVTDEPPPDPPEDPPKARGKIVKLREPEPPPPKKKVTRPAKRPKSQPATKWDPNGLFPEKK